MQKEMLFECLESHVCTLKAHNVKNMISRRIRIPWKDSTNKVDCGVYVMRQMNAYMRHGAKEWDCALYNGDMANLAQLRKTHFHSIATDEHNVHRGSNMERSLRFAKCSASKKSRLL